MPGPPLPSTPYRKPEPREEHQEIGILESRHSHTDGTLPCHASSSARNPRLRGRAYRLCDRLCDRRLYRRECGRQRVERKVLPPRTRPGDAMWRKARSLGFCLLLLSAPFWALAAQESTSSAPAGMSGQPLPPPLKLLQSAEDWLKIIEDSLNAQGNPVESLLKDLPELYRRSLALEKSVKELWELSGRLGESLKRSEERLRAIENDKLLKNKELGILAVFISIEIITIFLLFH